MFQLPFLPLSLYVPNSGNTLVVTTIDQEGKFNKTYQTLNEWNTGVRNPQLLAPIYGNDLISILTHDLDLIRINDDGKLQLHYVIFPDIHTSIMRLLGKIAEALIVQECKDLYANRRWGKHARKGKKLHANLDNYVAVGTGLKLTQSLYPTKYSSNDTQRDIIWLYKADPTKELLQIQNTPNQHNAISAGLQIKVSTDGLQYIYKSDIDKAIRYEVPLVYFDLSDDYYRLTNAIYKQEKDVQIGLDIIRGRDISPQIHDTLISYYNLIKDLFEGTRTIESLISDPLLFNSFTTEALEQKNVNLTTLSV